MMERVVITGLGIICGNANSKDEFAAALAQGTLGIKKCKTFNTEGLSTPYFGEAITAHMLREVYDPETATQNRFYDMLGLSLREMMKDAGVGAEDFAAMGNRCRMFFGTFLYYSETYALYWKGKHYGQEDHSLVLSNDYTAFARKITGIKGTAAVSTSACASSAAAVGMAMDYIRNGLCDVAAVVGIDALSLGEAYGFQALKLLSGGICNPYDKNRDGINIGEGCAVLLLESLSHAKARKAQIYGEVAGYALGNDAYHIISPEPTGESAYRVMKNALADAGITADQVDYINGHGTGTLSNDTMEMQAIEKLMADTDKQVWLSSTKSLVGHCMGAAGAVELISVLLSMDSGHYIPMPNLKDPIDHDEKIFMSGKAVPLDIKYALSNSFAFAGNSAAVVLKKYEGGGEG